MKKLTKILVVALTFALLVGTVFAFTVSAEEATQPETENKGPWIVSKNVSYEENTHLYFAIDSAVAADSTKLTLSVLDAQGNVLAEGLTVSVANHDIYKDGSKICHIIKTPGVAAKDFADVLTINVYYDGSAEPVESTTYSVAEYFLERLYKNEVINATEGNELSQKKLYQASMRYGAAAQKVLSPSDAVKVEDLIYVDSPMFEGITSKGYRLELDASNYKFDYYSDTNKGVDFDITGATGIYVLDESVKITNSTPAILAPDGSATFENLVISDKDLGATAGSKYLAIDGAVGGATGLKSVGSWSQKPDFHNITVEQDGSNKFLHSEITEQTGSLSHTIEVIRDTATEGDVLVFQTRMRINRAPNSNGNNQIRVYKGRNDGGGARHQFETITSAYSGDWFTYRVVFTNNASGGVDFKLYKAKDAASMVGAAPSKSGTISLNSGSAQSIAELNNFTMMLNTTFVGTLDWDYVFFTTVSDLAAVDALVETTEKIDVTIAPSIVPYQESSFEEHVITSGATLQNDNSTYTKNFGLVKEENGNKYISFEDTTTSGQAQLLFKSNEDLTDKDTLTLKFDLRLSPLAEGTRYGDSGDAVQIRIRNSKSSASTNTARLAIFVSDGKIAVRDMNGNTHKTDIAVSEWFTISVSYTSNSATSKVVVSDGVNTISFDANTKNADHQVPISELATHGMAIYTSTGLMCVWDIDNLSITASNSAN